MSIREDHIKESNQGVGKQLTRARNDAGKTQKEITTVAGFSVSLLNKLETGENLPSLNNLILLTELLDIPIEQLLQDYNKDLLIYAIDSYLARIDLQKSKSILSEVRDLIDEN